MDVRSNLSIYGSKAISIAQRYKLTLLTIAALPLIRLAYIDYRDWIALGRGGIPNNVFGWTIQCILRLVADRDVRSTGCYDALKTSDLERKAFLESDLPKRSSPKTGTWVVPHRQLEATASEALKQSLMASIKNLAESNPELIETGPSKIEGGVPSLFTLPTASSGNHAHYPKSPREIMHTHFADGSSHAILSATDAATVLERGWGERHGLSGRALGFPLNYTMIYAPRNDEDVAIVRTITRAAVRYCLEAKTIV